MTDEALSDGTESNEVKAASLESESPSEGERTDADPRKKSIWRRRITLISGLVALVAAVIVLPPLINVGRYQRQVTALMSRSLGRPVHLSGVELRLLPRPGFVLHDLTVGEDAAFGAEPVLSARTVVASVRIFSLWRGRTEISRISVDDASLNLVRSEQGRWNLESLMLGAQPVLTAARTGQSSVASTKPAPFPYLEATNSRVNLKNGVEKSPFSIVNTDLSLWQDEPGQWRVRLSGQPFRTDVQMSLADAGDLRLEGSLQTASLLRDMPLKLQAEWKEAQLGELSRLMLGSDSGWRGDLTAEIDVQGTLDNAQTKARLRASGVRREEIVPESPLDFDANCSFRYQRSQNAVHDLGCDTAIGDGRLHLKGEIPGNGGQPEGMLEVRQVPLQAGLDLLRTVRGGFAPGITARGVANGQLTYKVALPEEKPQGMLRRHALAGKAGQKAGSSETAPTGLQGTITLEGASITGGELKEPLVLPRMVWEPTQTVISPSVPRHKGTARGVVVARGPAGLGTRFMVPMPALIAKGAAATVNTQTTPPQSITVRADLGMQGYQVVLAGGAPAARLRELAFALGAPHLNAVDSLVAGTADLDLTATGPWMAASDVVTPLPSVSGAAVADGAPAIPSADSLAGTVQLHHVEWKAPYLASAVEMPQGLITISTTGAVLTSDFSFGGRGGSSDDSGKDSQGNAVHGSVQVTASAVCSSNDCQPQVSIRFATLDVGAMQAALLGAPTKKSLLSPLIDRMRSSDRPKWPALALGVQAESLVLGPVTLRKVSARIKMRERDVVLEQWDAGMLGGTASGTGHFSWADDSPKFAVEGTFTGVDATEAGALVQGNWSGSPLSGSGSVQLSGLTGKDLAASAVGDLRFNWQHGTMVLNNPGIKPASEADAEAGDETETAEQVRFESWTGALAIKGGRAELGENALVQGKRSIPVTGSIAFGGPVKLSLRHGSGREPQVAEKVKK